LKWVSLQDVQTFITKQKVTVILNLLDFRIY
jgi:hypothetical protein